MSSQAVQFPVTFKPGIRLVVPGPEHSCQELVIECRERISFRTVEEFYEFCNENPDSTHFAYTLRSRPS